MAGSVQLTYLFEQDAWKLSFPQGFYVLVTKEFAEEAKAQDLLTIAHKLFSMNPPKDAMYATLQPGGWQLPLHWNESINIKPPPPKPHAYQIAILCLPAMRQRWFKKTQGSISSPPFNEEQTIGFFMSQGFTLKLPKVIFEDERYSHIDLILNWLANNWMHLKGISGYDYTVDASTYYELNFEWVNIQKKLHVYDMGEGMLVPCELVHDIVAWLNEGKSKQMGLGKKELHALLYGAPMQQLKAPASVPIPKNPKQVTNATLEYYKKLLKF